MKVNLILAASLALTGAAAAHADNVDPTGPQTASAISAPKNLARQHLGANLLIYTTSSQSYTPTEAAAAWLDDDIATGWPALTGKQDYLLSLPQPELVNNFCISARSATGTVTLYAGDEAAPPGAKSWTLLEKDVPVDALNEKLGRPFGRFAKYILIETNLTDSGPWYSVYLYGDKDAAGYRIVQRAQPVDPHIAFGPYTNPSTSFNISSLYAHCKVTMAGGETGAWGNAIDDNPSSGTYVAATQEEAGLAIQYDHAYAVQRVSVLTDAGTKGKLDLFVVSQAPEGAAIPTTTRNGSAQSQYIKVANETVLNTHASGETPAAAGAAPATPVDLTNQHPVQTINFDGSSPRASVDFTPTSGTVLMARWTPDTPGQPLNLREVDSFGELALNDYQLAPPAVSEGPQDNSSAQSGGKETVGKETLPVGEEGKEPLPQVAEAPLKTPFDPGVPVFPPNIPIGTPPVSHPPHFPAPPPSIPVSP